MGGIKKSLKSARKNLRHSTKVAHNPFDSGNMDDLEESHSLENDPLVTLFTPEIPEPEQQPIIPIPDASLAENEARRRRARQSRTGRGSTILTGEKLGG